MRLLQIALIAAVLAGLNAQAVEPLVRPAQLGLCAACHGDSGCSVQPGMPRLAGQDRDYLKAALAAYRGGARDIAVMRAALGPVSAADLERLALWYSNQAPCVPNVER